MPKNNNLPWHPTASLEILRLRAELMHRIRLFFRKKRVLEVETPILSHATVTDPHLYSLSTCFANQQLFLQTSPEYGMKRLIAAGCGSIYQISKAFRDDERGKRHNPEFTLLEWYKMDFDHHQLMDEVNELLQEIADFPSAVRKTYQDIFFEYLEIDPLAASIANLQQCARAHQIFLHESTPMDKDAWLNLLLSHLIEPQLGLEAPLFVYDFPPSQAALAKIRSEPFPVAERFELYIQGMEIANGFHELTNAKEQRARFEADLAHRQRLGLSQPIMPELLLAALDQGLPPCSGVALGFDRLMMVITSNTSIQEVLSFPVENA